MYGKREREIKERVGVCRFESTHWAIGEKKRERERRRARARVCVCECVYVCVCACVCVCGNGERENSRGKEIQERVSVCIFASTPWAIDERERETKRERAHEKERASERVCVCVRGNRERET